MFIFYDLGDRFVRPGLDVKILVSSRVTHGSFCTDNFAIVQIAIYRVSNDMCTKHAWTMFGKIKRRERKQSIQIYQKVKKIPRQFIRLRVFRRNYQETFSYPSDISKYLDKRKFHRFSTVKVQFFNRTYSSSSVKSQNKTNRMDTDIELHRQHRIMIKSVAVLFEIEISMITL